MCVYTYIYMSWFYFFFMFFIPSFMSFKHVINYLTVFVWRLCRSNLVVSVNSHHDGHLGGTEGKTQHAELGPPYWTELRLFWSCHQATVNTFTAQPQSCYRKIGFGKTQTGMCTGLEESRGLDLRLKPQPLGVEGAAPRGRPPRAVWGAKTSLKGQASN